MAGLTTGTQQWRLALEAEYQARLGAWSDIQGHLRFLYDRAAAIPGARLLELGVRSGNSTAVLLYAADTTDGHLWSVDLEPPRAPSWWPLTGRWSLIIGDDLKLAADAQAVPVDPLRQGWRLPNQVDLLLLDTSHTYDHTLAELRAYVPRVRPGGVVCCHDTLLVGHDQRGFGIEGDRGPVADALDAYCAEVGLTWSNRPGSFGMGVLEIPA
jgi:predicted O-methyltransferase YrrM